MASGKVSRPPSRPASRGNTSDKAGARFMPMNSSSIWRSDTTLSDNLTKNDFYADLNKESKTKGSFEEDYTFYCNSYGIVPCSFVKTKASSTDQMFIMSIDYCSIDESSFRAALLAMSCIGSRICEIHIHGCMLSPQNIIDLGAALAKVAFVNILRIEFLQLHDKYSTSEYADAFKQLLSSDFGTDYLSFRQSKLGNTIISTIASALTQNYTIKSMNLSGCNVSSSSYDDLMNALYTNIYLESISLANNSLSGLTIMEKLIQVIRGKPANNDDVAAMKSVAKKSSERLKKIKEINRKRKKSSLNEFSEAEVSAGERIVKGSDSQPMICNRLLNFIDISDNPIDAVDINGAADKLSTVNSLLTIPENYEMTVRISNIANIELSSTYIKLCE
jgi:hypothetical protein